MAGETSSGVRWLLLSLTLLLVALAVFQLVYLAPLVTHLAQKLDGAVPGTLRLLLTVPEWVTLVAGLGLGTFAVWHRGSLHRVSLLAIVALAVNVGVLISILSSLVQVLSR